MGIPATPTLTGSTGEVLMYLEEPCDLGQAFFVEIYTIHQSLFIISMETLHSSIIYIFRSNKYAENFDNSIGTRPQLSG